MSLSKASLPGPIIITSRSALEGERKQVTILFADVRGSTELASELDPEEWHRIMDDRFFGILSEGVQAAPAACGKLLDALVRCRETRE
jgi:hypothetical protein